ncbi:MAG: methyltransferase domain-containing protein [Thermomicrobiales bacterium]|nr:methyltransferase domain-containing protein [Thermomicrobiales bacterium]
MSERVRRIYDRRAAVYDRTAGAAEGMLLGDFRRRFGALLRGRTLEGAVGTGLNLPYYSPAVTEAFGVDFSIGMLREARQRARALGLPMRFVQADAQALPFPAAAFDTVAISLALCTVADPPTALREMARVCRPDGRIVLLEHVASPVGPVYALERLLSPLQERQMGCNLTRRTVDTVRELGFRIEAEESRWWGVFRLVIARPPAL